MNMYTATVIKSGNSYALRIPKRLAEDAHLEVGQKVDIPTPIAKATDTSEPNGTRMAELFEELQRIVAADKKKGIGLGMIEDPVAWQREIRQDRPLPGRK